MPRTRENPCMARRFRSRQAALVSTCLATLVAVVLASIVLAGVVRAAPAADLAYRFQLVRQPELRMRVRLTAAGGPDGTTTFEVEREWGGVSAGGDDISEVMVTNAAGKSLTVEHPEPHRWRVTNVPKEML